MRYFQNHRSTGKLILVPGRSFDRRGFMKTALGSAFAAAVLPVSLALPPAAGADELPGLVRDYEASVPQASERTEEAYRRQADTLAAIADRRSEPAQDALKHLLIKYGGGDSGSSPARVAP